MCLSCLPVISDGVVVGGHDCVMIPLLFVLIEFYISLKPWTAC